MADNKILFENPLTGAVKEAPVGFSWTVLLFHFFPPLFRGDWKWGAIMFILACMTGGLSVLVFMFMYNKLYIKDLVGAGFKVRSIESGSVDQAAAKLGMVLPTLDR